MDNATNAVSLAKSFRSDTPLERVHFPLGLRVKRRLGEEHQKDVEYCHEAALIGLWNGHAEDVLAAAFCDVAEWDEPRPIAAPSLRERMWSVVIPVRGAHDRLAKCLEYLAASRFDGDVRIVCHESEGDAVEEIAADTMIEDSDFTVELTDAQLGFAAACNRGASECDGNRILFLNSDAYVQRRWREAFDLALDVGPACGPAGTNVSGFQCVDAIEHPWVLDPWIRRREPCVVPAEIPRLVGFCMAVRREEFFRVGGWNEAYGVGNFDDDDLSLRLALLRTKGSSSLLWTPHLVVEHEGSASFRELQDPEATYQRLMLENGRKFSDRWGWAHSHIHRWWRL